MSRATFTAVALFALTFAAPVSAEPVYPGHAYDYRSGDYIPAPPAAPPGVYVAPAYPVPAPVAVYPVPAPPVLVYARPANCGVYRYWNGTECLDARYDPPQLFGN